ncbi:phosphoglycerate mutase family protein [Schizosaccharomyces octosporus yFS286]|uniref:Phosphoglycerate mutase family protein n=1 Tax=Schizosaccharomyces octosporus (strain yFS286) TaxID=483514 RepID=S9Q5P6_SCHOY|nr:phosphoglycerate mutase family protein [Schizosaccharomyces octosporus yFS286]EPX75387.1 phosphoglycerate mutase family protein [Schizosaccharomyces octosporus yFS286]
MVEKSSPQAKTVYIVRHGQAEHNVGPDEDHRIRDPNLTQLGRSQADELREKLSQHPISFDLIVCSPMRRTLQTMEIGLRDSLQTGIIPIDICPLVEEAGDWPCDIGLEVEETAQKFPKYNFKACQDGVYPAREGIYRGDYESNMQRATKALEYIKNLPQKEIVVVTHSVFIRFLLRQQKPEEDLNFMPSEKVFKNCECRKYSLDFKDDELQLIPA